MGDGGEGTCGWGLSRHRANMALSISLREPALSGSVERDEHTQVSKHTHTHSSTDMAVA